MLIIFRTCWPLSNEN